MALPLRKAVSTQSIATNGCLGATAVFEKVPS
jgi:hypothetical protein